MTGDMRANPDLAGGRSLPEQRRAAPRCSAPLPPGQPPGPAYPVPLRACQRAVISVAPTLMYLSIAALAGRIAQIRPVPTSAGTRPPATCRQDSRRSPAKDRSAVTERDTTVGAAIHRPHAPAIQGWDKRRTAHPQRRCAPEYKPASGSDAPVLRRGHAPVRRQGSVRVRRK